MEGSPEVLLGRLLTTNDIIQTNLEDNEYVVQVLLSMFRAYMQLYCAMQEADDGEASDDSEDDNSEESGDDENGENGDEDDDDDIEGITQAFNSIIMRMGYIVYITPIDRNALKSIVYYSRLTPNYELLKSQFHPLYLMQHMPETPPQSYQLLMNNNAYLPNIVCIWDKHYTMYELRFRKANLRTLPSAMV